MNSPPRETGSPTSVITNISENDIPDSIFNNISAESISCRYQQLRDVYDIDNIFCFTYELVLRATNGYADNSVELLDNLSTILKNIPDINIELDRNDWFWRDHYKYTIYTTNPDTGKTVTSHSPRIYYWEDEGTDYYMFAQELVTILSELDIWYKEKYQHDNIENNNSLKKIIDWYEMMHRIYEKVCENSDTEDEDSIS